MVNYTEHQLSNGLTLIIHEDHSNPIVCLNLLYKVGSRNENPEKTGFAHLFEHLMFGGSKNIQNFDEPLQKVGGENNAFTNTDITNYYITVPSNNVETAFWLESDRMLGLSFDPKVLDVQKKVVVEEFKQRYLNQPYGDLWLKLRPLAYHVHPYRWPTIGKDVSHIEQVTMDDVKDFFSNHYRPSNAILVVSGDISEKRAITLTEKWFGEIEERNVKLDSIKEEPKQTESRQIEAYGSVPSKAIYKVFHMASRFSDEYFVQDLMSDILGRGKSSLLYQKLVKEKPIFSSISSYVTGSFDPGLMVISGKLNEGMEIEEANDAIHSTIDYLIAEGVDNRSLEKVKNQSESTHIFSQVELLNRAMGLAFASFLGDTNLINEEPKRFREVTKDQIIRSAEEVLIPENSSTMFYLPKN